MSRCRFTARRPLPAALCVLASGLVPALPAAALQAGQPRDVPAPEGVAAAQEAAQATERRTENVILVTIDGLRWQEVFGGADRALLDAAQPEGGRARDLFAAAEAAYWRDTRDARREALLPFLWGTLATGGQLYGNAWRGSEVRVTNDQLFSYPGYNELLAGFADERINSNAKRPNPNLTVLEWLHGRPGFEGRVAAFGSWDVFPYILAEERSGVYVNGGWEALDDEPLTDIQVLLNGIMRDTPWIWDNVRYDGITFYAALEHLRKHRSRLLYIALDAPDSRAHEGRYDLYLEAANRFDRLLAHLWQMLQGMPEYADRTTLLVTTDHGRGDGPEAWRGHGAAVEGADRIWIGILGPDTPARGEATDTPPLTQAQVAATVAALLGEDFRAAQPQAAPPIPGALGILGAGPGPPAGPGPQAAPDSLPGIWQGTLTVPGGVELRLVFRIARAEDSGYTASLDSPDQGAQGIPITEVAFADGGVRLTSGPIGGVFEGQMSADGARIEGEWRQGGASLPLTVERVDEVERPARPQEPEPPYPYREEEVRYPNPEAEIELAGTLTLPAGEGPFPAAVLISGSGPQDRDETVFGHRPFWIIADHLTRQGIAVLRFDDRGVGESGGSPAGATSEDFAGDVRAGLAYLRGRPEIDPNRIGLIGHSEGGLIAPLVAAEGGEVAFVVLLAGTGIRGDSILLLQAALIGRAAGRPEEAIARNGELQRTLFRIVREEPDPERAELHLREAITASIEAMGEAERAAAGIQEGNLEAIVAAQVSQANSAWLRFFLDYDPGPTLERLRMPVLALNGELDLQVPADVNLEAIAAALGRAGNPDVTLRKLEGLNHLFQAAATGSPAEYAGIEQTFAPAALELLASWIVERFGR